MKRFAFCLLLFTIPVFAASAQGNKSTGKPAKIPGSCKMYLDGNIVSEISLDDAVKWCELTPPTVKCDDGKIYSLESFQVSFFTLKPLMNREFGIGEGGFPILAREAIAKGNPGDAIVLKEVTYALPDGGKGTLPVMSFKLK